MSAASFMLSSEPGDSSKFQYIEIVPVVQANDSPCTAECDGGNCSAETKKEIVPTVMQEFDDVHVSCSLILYSVVHKTM